MKVSKFEGISVDATDFPAVFACFIALLKQNSTHHIWDFDMSPELPHTLFSEVKSNPSFQNLLQSSCKDTSMAQRQSSSDHDVTSWMTDYLVSLTEVETTAQTAPTAGNKPVSGFGEALAKVSNFCFSEMQHARLDAGVRAAVARAGIDVSHS